MWVHACVALKRRNAPLTGEEPGEGPVDPTSNHDHRQNVRQVPLHHVCETENRTEITSKIPTVREAQQWFLIVRSFTRSFLTQSGKVKI